MKSIQEYEFNGRPRTPTNLLLLISELEGSFQHLKYLGFEDDMFILEDLKKKYHKLYFQASRGGA